MNELFQWEHHGFPIAQDILKVSIIIYKKKSYVNMLIILFFFVGFGIV